jgi:hypothetical protein
MQRPARQHPLPPHFWPAQQAWPGAPQTTQMLFWQMVPAPQALAPGQQASPGPPQATQVPAAPTTLTEQRVPGSLQDRPQQLSPRRPQPEQRPAWQVPPPVGPAGPQAAPLCTQMLE